MFKQRMRPVLTGAMLGIAAGAYWVTAGCGHQVVSTTAGRRPWAHAVVPAPSAGANPAPQSVNDLSEIPRVPAATVVDLPDRSRSDVYHEVQPGDTISGIARKYGRSPQAILDANGLEASAILHPRQLIYIP